MALEVTQVHRNLHQRVTWLYLEIEDMFMVLGLGALANFIGRFLGREILRDSAQLHSSVGGADPGDSSSVAFQVWKTARVPSRSADLADQAPYLLRSGAGPRTYQEEYLSDADHHVRAQESVAQAAALRAAARRDYLDGVLCRWMAVSSPVTNSTGLNSYYHDDDMRNRSKRAFEALVRSLPERSMRMQVRFEITEGIGDVRKHVSSPQPEAKTRCCRTSTGSECSNGTRTRQKWSLSPAYPARLSSSGILALTTRWRTGRKERRNWFSLSAEKCIQRERREHEDLLSEFRQLMAGVEQTLGGDRNGHSTHDGRRDVCRGQAGLNPVVRRPRALPARRIFDRLPKRPGTDRQTPASKTSRRATFRSEDSCTRSSA